MMDLSLKEGTKNWLISKLETLPAKLRYLLQKLKVITYLKRMCPVSMLNYAHSRTCNEWRIFLFWFEKQILRSGVTERCVKFLKQDGPRRREMSRAHLVQRISANIIRRIYATSVSLISFFAFHEIWPAFRSWQNWKKILSFCCFSYLWIIFWNVDKSGSKGLQTTFELLRLYVSKSRDLQERIGLV